MQWAWACRAEIWGWDSVEQDWRRAHEWNLPARGLCGVGWAEGVVISKSACVGAGADGVDVEAEVQV